MRTARSIKALILWITLTLATAAHAVLPDGGWYWNPNEGGRGFNIEIQNNVLFMSAFVYDAAGKPIWLVSGGTMATATTYLGEVYQTSGGQCMGCPYQPAAKTLYGTGSVSFTGPTTATITINGNAMSVQRQAFGLDFSSTATSLLGEWAFVEGQTAVPAYFGDRIALRTTYMNTTEIPNRLWATGSRAGATGSANIAVGSVMEASSKTWGILLDSSSSYYNFFVFTAICILGLDSVFSRLLVAAV